MSFFQFAIIGMIILAAVKIFTIVYGTAPAVNPELLKSIEERLQGLEKRMENMETIVISKRADLMQEIENLSRQD